MGGKKTIRLGFAGDLMLGGEALAYAQERGLNPTYPFKAFVATLRSLDLLFVNLEGPLFANQAAALPKPFILSNHRSVVKILRLPKKCVCSLANNHSLDYGPDALTNTQRFLDKHCIWHVGAGHSAAEAGREIIVHHAGWRIGCFAFTARGPSLLPVFARDGQPGCASMPKRSVLLERVRRLKARVDLVIVMLHWGREFYEYPSPSQIRLAHGLVDAGADLIAGHHPHVIQPVEQYNGSVIAYSLGHLFMPPFRLPNQGPRYYPRPASKEFMMLRVEVPNGFPAAPGLVDTVAGALDSCFRLRPYNRIGLQTFRSRLDDLACPLGNGRYTRFWRHYRTWRQRQLQALQENR